MTSKEQGETADTRALSRLGYAEELLRAMGGFSTFALSFSVISVLTGVVTTYGVAIAAGGPAGLGIGWPLVSLGTLVVALAMGELASAFPTAGALYHWSAILGGPGLGWFTAMMNLVGQCAIVAAVDLGCAHTLVVTLRLPPPSELPVLGVILASHGALNVLSVRLVAWANDFSATVHILGVLVLVGLLFAFGRAHPVGYLMQTGSTTRPDGSYGLGFANALLLGVWTFTGFDASAHVSEETRDPARRAPWAIFFAVLVSAVAGYALVCALTLAIPSLDAVVKEDAPPLFILRSALGDRLGSATMGLAITAMWFCGLSSVTSASRTLFAFSRDGGLPFSHVFRRVSPSLKTPHVAIVTAVVLPMALVLCTSRLSESVFLAVASLATTALYVSYATPIFLGAIARHTNRWSCLGPWNLGRFGLATAWGAVLWTVAVLVVCALPPNQTAGYLLAAVVAVLAAVYVFGVRGRFRGPPISLADMQRAAHEKA